MSSSLRLGISFMAAYAVLQALIWAIVRGLGNELSTETLFFFRNLIGVITLSPMLFKHGRGLFETQRFMTHFWRALASGAGALTLYYAVEHAPLGTVVAITFAAPIFASLVAILFYKEPATVAKLFALGLGFMGASFVARPSMAGDLSGIVAAFIGAIATAAAFLLVKTLATTEKAPTVVALPFFILLPISAIIAAFNWTTPEVHHILPLLGIGVGFSAVQYAMAKAFHYAEASAVLPIDYLRLIAASAIGTLYFGDAINAWVFAGALLILSASVITVRQKRSA
ncbi:MAG: DMT family transporter [Sphingomonadales bacterium]|jgi:drug/metabolite transporter (DMT)-like permease